LDRFIFSLKMLVAFIAISLIAIYFRTYPLHGGIFLALRSSESIARGIVEEGMRGQIGAVFEQNFPQLSAEERGRLVYLQIERLKQENRAQYEEALRQTKAGVERARGTVRKMTYLLEADPYHYFYQAEKLLEEGPFKNPVKDGKIFQPLMRFPHGHWEPILLHPDVGLLTYRVLRLIDPGITLMQAVGWVPIFLTILVLGVYVWLGKILTFDPWGTVVGMLALALSPIFIQRSALGWFDTDPYNYIFPGLILASSWIGLSGKKRFVPAVLGASFFTGLYSLFWTGWPFIFALLPAGLVVSGALLWALKRFHASPESLRAGIFAAAYTVLSLIFLAVFMTPQGLVDSLLMNWSVFNKFALPGSDLWPNIFLTVGEAGGATFAKLVFLTGNPVTFVLALLGVFFEGRRAFKNGDPLIQFRFLFFLVFTVPLFVMALKTERFSVLFVLPLAVFISFAVNGLLSLCKGNSSNVGGKGFWDKVSIRRAGMVFLILLIFLPMLLISAHVVAAGIRPIMDDVWYGALREVRSKTPADAVVNSWWPPGYFIAGIAHRRVTVDGGTQQNQASYWMAKVLMAEDEREAAGILRMLNTGGESATALLIDSGMEVPEAVELLLKIAPLGRSEAHALLPSFLDEKQKAAVLDAMQGHASFPPTYVLVYNDMVEQNLAVSVMSQWDFKKAREIRGKPLEKEGEGFWKGLWGGRNSTYIKELPRITGEFLRYASLSPLIRREGTLLWFKNGLRVDLGTKDAIISFPSERVQGRPSQLFYLERGKLVSRAFEENVLKVSALFFEAEGTYYSVIADARLIRSLLFRLYYLNGQGLDLFRPLVSRGSLAGGTVVRVFELEREKLSA